MHSIAGLLHTLHTYCDRHVAYPASNIIIKLEGPSMLLSAQVPDMSRTKEGKVNRPEVYTLTALGPPMLVKYTIPPEQARQPP